MDKNLRKQVIDFLNSKINLPLLNEEQEERLFAFLVDEIIALVPTLLVKVGA